MYQRDLCFNDKYLMFPSLRNFIALLITTIFQYYSVLITGPIICSFKGLQLRLIVCSFLIILSLSSFKSFLLWFSVPYDIHDQSLQVKHFVSLLSSEYLISLVFSILFVQLSSNFFFFSLEFKRETLYLYTDTKTTKLLPHAPR